MYCRKCGKELTPNSQFCSVCGASVNKENGNMSKEAQQQKSHRFFSRKNVILSAVGIVVISILAFVIALSGKNTLSEKEIRGDISEYSEFEKLGLSIREYNEEKRDTDKKNKYDHIWVDVIAENDKVQYEASYYIEYGLYNDGWILENIEILDDDYRALEMITLEQVSNDLQTANRELISNYELTNISVSADIPKLTDKLKTVRLICDVTAENDECSFSASAEVTYRLFMLADKSGWVMTGSQTTDYSYETKTIPSSSLLDETTSGWADNYELLTEGKVASNTYVYTFEEHDEEAFLDVIADWENTLTYKYDLDKGGWYLFDEDYKVTSAELNVNGYWTYSNGDEYVKLNVHSADYNTVKYDIDAAIESSNILSVGSNLHKGSGTDVVRDWTAEYIEDELCLVFTATKPAFTISFVGGSYTEEYILYYKAYIGEVMGTSGFYIDDMLLTKQK